MLDASDKPPASASDLADAANAFGAALYGRLRTTPGNLVISPASIELALLLAWGGAREETASQMREVLRLESLGGDAHASAGALLRAWNDPARSSYELAVVNRLFLEKTAPIEAAFVELTKTHYGAGHELLDFKGSPDPSRIHINAWVAQQTRDRIQDLLPAGSLDELTDAVLINAVYFLGKWKSRFDRAKTVDRIFHVEATTPVKLPTMRQRQSYKVAHGPGLSVLQMPYVGNDMAMVIVLPHEDSTLQAAEERVVAGEYRDWLSRLRTMTVEVSLPRFKIEMPTSLKLKAPLSAMGMPLAFTGDANFEGISNPENPDDKLRIANVYHKAFVEVDEAGTEAAAATAVVMKARGGGGSHTPSFKVDRPFLFMIRDLKSGAFLFLGRVTDPRR